LVGSHHVARDELISVAAASIWDESSHAVKGGESPHVLNDQGVTRANVGEGVLKGGADVRAGVNTDDTTPNFDEKGVRRVSWTA